MFKSKTFQLIAFMILTINLSLADNSNSTISFQTFKNQQSNLIIVIPSNTSTSTLNMSANRLLPEVKEQITDINLRTVSSFVKEVRDSICSVISNGSIKTWVTVGAETNTLVVSATANTGLEVTINCSKSKQ